MRYFGIFDGDFRQLPAWSSLFGWSRSASSSSVATGAAPPSAAESTRWNAFVHELEDRLAPLIRPERPDTSGMARLSAAETEAVRECGGYQVAINASSGAIAMLKDAKGRVLAGPGHNLGTFAYYTFSSVRPFAMQQRP